jgi:hypothetical protein
MLAGIQPWRGTGYDRAGYRMIVPNRIMPISLILAIYTTDILVIAPTKYSLVLAAVYKHSKAIYSAL